MKASQKRRFCGKMEYLPLWPTYIGEKGEDFGQNITYSKGRRDEMILSIHLSRHLSRHPSKQNKYIFSKRGKTRKKKKNRKTL
jgi:hypothetical protein